VHGYTSFGIREKPREVNLFWALTFIDGFDARKIEAASN
jgi:hypothetical protein